MGATPLPFKTTMEFAYGEPRELVEGVSRVVANNPGPFTFKGTNTYLVGTRSLAVIEDLDAVGAQIAVGEGYMHGMFGNHVAFLRLAHHVMKHSFIPALLRADMNIAKQAHFFFFRIIHAALGFQHRFAALLRCEFAHDAAQLDDAGLGEILRGSIRRDVVRQTVFAESRKFRRFHGELRSGNFQRADMHGKLAHIAQRVEPQPEKCQDGGDARRNRQYPAQEMDAPVMESLEGLRAISGVLDAPPPGESPPRQLKVAPGRFDTRVIEYSTSPKDLSWD